MELITLIVIIVVFACVIWALNWACASFGMPPPVKWIIGAIIIIILLAFLLNVTGLYTGGFNPNLRLR